MSEIDDFRAVLERAEEMANAATDHLLHEGTCPGLTEVCEPLRIHAHAWSPARALRWVAAVREILAEHEPSTGPMTPYCRCCSDARGDYVELWPCPTVRALMSVYQEEGS